MVSNGTLIDEKMANLIHMYDIKVTISIDGPEEIHDLNPRRVHSPMLASQQTNDERSESRADTPQLAAGSFIG